MKQTILVLFCFALFGLARVADAQGSGYSVITQNSNCKKLIVKLNNYDYTGLPIYVPDDSIPGNKLNNSYYNNTLGLEKMTFDQAMDFIKKIYTSTNANCKTLVCNCSRNGVIDAFGTYYSIYFRNASNFAGVKSIITELDKVATSKSQSEIMALYKSEYPSVDKLLVKAEYTANRMNFYKNWQTCFNSSYNLSTQLECNYFSNVYNRQVPIKPSNVQLENQMVCSFMSYDFSCNPAYLRVSAMWSWAQWFSKLKFTGSSLPAYFDKLFKRAQTYQPSAAFSYAVVTTNGKTLKPSGYNAETKTLTVNSSTASFLCFNSSQFRIDCSWAESSGSSKFTQLTITFFLPKGSNPPTMQYQVDTSPFSSYSYSIQNGQMFKNSKGTKIYQVFLAGIAYNYYLIIYEFSSQSKIQIMPDRLHITSPLKFLKSANGIMVDGLNL